MRARTVASNSGCTQISDSDSDPKNNSEQNSVAKTVDNNSKMNYIGSNNSIQHIASRYNSLRTFRLWRFLLLPQAC